MTTATVSTTASAMDRALDAGRASSASPQPGCRGRSAPRAAHPAASRRLLRARPEPRRHRRALALVHRAGRQRAANRAIRGHQHGRRRRRVAHPVRCLRRRTSADRSSATALVDTRGGRCTPSSSTTTRPCPLHIHHRDEHAAALGKKGKPEAYYFAPQMNSHLGELGHHLLRACIRRPPGRSSPSGSRASPMAATTASRSCPVATGSSSAPAGTCPPACCTPPASICTYEPQCASDVSGMCESWSNGREVPERAALEGRARGPSRRRRLHRRAARLGEERRPALRRTPLHGALQRGMPAGRW